MLTVTLAQLQAEVQKRADVQNSTNFVPLSDITEYLNRSWARLYGKICRAGENYYLVNPAPQFTSVSNNQTYYTTAAANVPAGTNVLPTNIYLVKGLDVQVGGTGRWLNCDRFNWERRNDFQNQDFFQPMVSALFDYQGSGANAAIFIQPPPSGSIPFRLWYYPAAVPLANVGDTIDTGNRWDSYVIDWAARLIAEKDENYELCARLDGQIAKLELEIMGELASRNSGQAPKIRRHRYRRTGWPFGFPGGVP